MVMQPMILPMVFTIAESQDKNDFELSTLPALVPVLNSAAGETLLLLVKHADVIIHKAGQEHLISHVLPMLVRAFDETDSRLQEEVLKKTLSLAKQLDLQLVKQAILPRVHGLALKTTVAAVRVNALLCLSDMVHMLDKHAVLEVLQTIQRCTAVDRSAPTLMCTLNVANSVLKQYGVEFVAEHVLPLLTPLLIAQQLNVQQFAKYMHFVKDILRKIEEKRGVTLSDNGIPEPKPCSAGNGPRSGAVNKTSTTVSSSVMTKSTSWDDDWIPSRQSATALSSAAKPSTQSTLASSGSLQSLVTSTLSSQQLPTSVPAVDVEWPPRSSTSDLTTQLGNSENLIGDTASSNSSLDDIDPFANWPPRPSGSTSAPGSSSNGTMASKLGSTYGTGITNDLNLQSNNTTSWAFGSQNSTEPMRQNQGNKIKGINPQSSLGYLKQNQGVSSHDTSVDRATDLGSIFAVNKGEQTAPRLAPPPATAIGRGRGRGRGNQGQTGATSTSRPSKMKPQSEQPPLLDLL